MSGAMLAEKVGGRGSAGRGRGWTAIVAAMALLGAGAGTALAGDRSLIAGLRVGDEMRYTFGVRCDETTGAVGRPGTGLETITTEDVRLLVRVKADTTALDIVEVVFEGYKVSMDSGQGKLEIDLGGPAPDDKAPAPARDLYAKLHGLVGTVLTLNIAPGSGEITVFHGGEDLLKSAGAPVLRRYVDEDLFKARFGAIFQLKSNTAMPPPGQPWYVKGHVFAFAHMAKTPVWETRTLEGVVADVATITGSTRANGNPDDAAKAPIFLKSVTASSVYKWDTFRGRLVSVTRDEVINSRSDRAGTLYDSDLISKSTLALAGPGASVPAKPDAKPGVEAPPSGGGKPAP